MSLANSEQIRKPVFPAEVLPMVVAALRHYHLRGRAGWWSISPPIRTGSRDWCSWRRWSTSRIGTASGWRRDVTLRWI